MDLQDIILIGDDGSETDHGVSKFVPMILLRFLHHGIDGIVQKIDDGLAEHIRVAVQRHRVFWQVKGRLDAILFLLLGIVLRNLFLHLLQHG